jgi:RNA polymerase sigma-70 factor (ECF subfamily)
LIDRETCEIIIEKYYDNVYKLCISRLKNIQAAEECTQEVFLILFQKREKLDFTENLRSWLYEAANRICKKYISKNNVLTVDIDEFAEEIPDTNITDQKPFSQELYEFLSKDDADLLLEYIEADHGKRSQISKRLGITNKALYRRMDRIRKKVIAYLNE